MYICEYWMNRRVETTFPLYTMHLIVLTDYQNLIYFWPSLKKSILMFNWKCLHSSFYHFWSQFWSVTNGWQTKIKEIWCTFYIKHASFFLDLNREIAKLSRSNAIIWLRYVIPPTRFQWRWGWENGVGGWGGRY